MPEQFVTMLANIGRAAENAGPMRPSTSIRRRGDQRRNHRRAAVGVLSVVAAGALVATGALIGNHRTADYLPPGHSSSASPTATAGPTATTSPSGTGSPSAPTGSGTPPAAATTLSVSIGGLTGTTVAIGGNAIEFTVTVTNSTTHTFRDIAPNVAAGHCTCSDHPLAIAPNGTLAWRQADGTWQPIQYTHEAGGMDYANVQQVPGFTLAPGASRSFTFRMSFTAAPQVTYHNGQTSIDVTMVGLAGYSGSGPTLKLASPGTPGAYALVILGTNAEPAASAPIQVTTS